MECTKIIIVDQMGSRNVRCNFSVSPERDLSRLGFVTCHARREREREVERPDAGQFHGPRVIVVAANRSATWPDAACHGAARWPSLFPLVVSVTPLDRADFHRRCY